MQPNFLAVQNVKQQCICLFQELDCSNGEAKRWRMDDSESMPVTSDVATQVSCTASIHQMAFNSGSSALWFTALYVLLVVLVRPGGR